MPSSSSAPTKRRAQKNRQPLERRRLFCRPYLETGAIPFALPAQDKGARGEGGNRSL
ncbi:hypothetical protein EMIT0P265_70345 [Pseudomonas zeae]